MAILYTLLIVGYYISLFFQSDSLKYVVGILVIIAILLAIPKTDRLYRIAGCSFLVIGIFLFFQQGKPVRDLPDYMTSTVTLLSVLFVLPFINSIIIAGRYDRNVNKLLKGKINHMGQLYSRTSFVTFLLGTFLNIATLPLVKSVVSKNIQHKAKQFRDKFITESILRGYALSLSCSPMELMVVLSIEFTGVSYLTFLPWLLTFVACSFSINWLVGRKYKKHELDKTQVANNVVDIFVIKKIISLVMYLLVFITIIILLNASSNMGFFEIVALVIIPYSILWALSIKRFKSYFSYALPIWKANTRALHNYMVLFLSVGFFTSILNQSYFLDYIQAPFEVLTSVPVILFVCIQLLFLGFAMVGFHPLVTISILTGVLAPVLEVINPISIGMVLITSGLSTVLAGPFNISVSLIGGILGRNPYQVSKWNLGYAFLFSSLGTTIALVILYV